VDLRGPVHGREGEVGKTKGGERGKERRGQRRGKRR